MALVMPLLLENPAFDGMTVEDQVDAFARMSMAFGTCVISGCQVTQDSGSDMYVQVSSGLVSIQGNVYTWGGGGVAIPSASAGDRRDTIVLRVMQSATPYVQALCIKGTVPSGLVGAWNRNTNPATALPPEKGPMSWLPTQSTPPSTSVDYTTDAVCGEVYVAFNTTAITGTASSILSPTTGNIVDKTGNHQVIPDASFTAAVQSVPLNTMTPQAATSWNNERMINMGAGILASSSTTAGQLAGYQIGYVISGCVWTADNVGVSLNASMTAGMVMIKGIQLTVAAVTSRAFTASMDTYIDLQDNGDGTANITYSTVTNNSLSPAMAGGSMQNTIRIGVITAGASTIAANGNIGQGSPNGIATGGSLGSSTVSASSTGQSIAALTGNQLILNSISGFSTGGGWVVVQHSTMNYLLRYTGVNSGSVSLTGITSANVIAGTGTVLTSDAVSQVFSTDTATTAAGPMGVTDFLGNLIYPTNPYPSAVAYAAYTNAFTTTSTSAWPVSNLTAPFVIPAGPARRFKITVLWPQLKSSAAAGTSTTVSLYIGNSQSGGTLINEGTIVNAVASDTGSFSFVAMSGNPLPAGSYTAQVALAQGAAGTLTAGVTYLTSFLAVELV